MGIYIRFFFVVTFCLLLTSSCNDKKDRLIGVWAVDSIELNKKEVSLFELGVNMVTFEKGGICIVPLENALQENATWEIKLEDGCEIVNISSSSKYFIGDFKIYELKSKNPKVILMSNKIVIYLSKIGI